MKIAKILMLSVVCASLSYADIAENIVEAKKKVGELEAQYTELGLKIARESQKLRELQGNAMLDTQNFITSEKKKDAEVKELIAKVNSLEKKTDDLNREIQSLSGKVSDTADQQKESLRKELSEAKSQVPIIEDQQQANECIPSQ